MLLELGRLAGLVMFGTVSPAKHSVVSAYGAVPIDYRTEDFVRVLEDQAPGGIDAVFDPIGGPNWERSIRTLGAGGRFIGYGYTSALGQGNSEEWVKEWSSPAAKRVTENGQSIQLYSITSWKKERPDWFMEDAGQVLDLLREGRIRPLIYRRIPLREAAEAHRLLEGSQAAGKVVLVHVHDEVEE
ncbi:zinc-binding dehydrogenase [Paenibacillus filicis]|uniref:Zinc-binding dehydrogenase n=1 Tax=Paenibacillus gyeongsangnamensis TaxID=3388067 RepID=A0ABT4Q8Q2_9BACL|nr:zinc-binding dehydrogenase [Paenibacillus filicis]MCZ8513259.1 zinc-binding dehydrogenase [Paenibacillus filicis]